MTFLPGGDFVKLDRVGVDVSHHGSNDRHQFQLKRK
jgi:hypothetical protein